MNSHKTNEAGIELIKKYEGVVLTAYRDCVGIPTIGFGHIKGVRMGTTISEQEADTLLREDLKEAEHSVKALTDYKLNINQFSALVSFTFNLGHRALSSSTLLKKINEGKLKAAPKQIKRWNKAGGKILVGLTRRRESEAELWSTPVS